MPIGQIDPATGQPIYKPEYLARMAATGVTVEGAASMTAFTAEDIRQSSVLEFGAMYLLEQIASGRLCNGRCPICPPRFFCSPVIWSPPVTPLWIAKSG